MTILLFQFKAGLGVEHGNHLPVYIQDNREDDWKPQPERIRMIVGASESARGIEGNSVGEQVIPAVEIRENIPHIPRIVDILRWLVHIGKVNSTMLSEKRSMKFFKRYPILPTKKLIVRLTDCHFHFGGI